MEAQFVPLFFVLLASVLFAIFFTRLHLPWVVGLILGGMIIGPYGLELFESNQTIDFLGELGLVFLLFMAGLETRLSSLKGLGKGIFGLVLLNGGLPFLVGFGIGTAFGFDTIASLLVGIVFSSSSVAIIIPTLEARGLMDGRLGQSITAGTIIMDVSSFIFLSIVLQSVTPSSTLSLPMFLLFLLVALIGFRLALPKIRWALQLGLRNSKALFQQEVRTVLVILVGTVVVFQLIGLHPIVAGFFAGLVLSSDSIDSKVLNDKVKTIAYGVFIPIFFVIVGAQTDMSVFAKLGTALPLTAAVIIGSLTSKFGTGWFAARLMGFANREALVMGAATLPQLGMALAVAFTAGSLGLLDSNLTTAIVMLSVLTVIPSPILVNYFMSRPRVARPVETRKALP